MQHHTWGILRKRTFGQRASSVTYWPLRRAAIANRKIIVASHREARIPIDNSLHGALASGPGVPSEFGLIDRSNYLGLFKKWCESSKERDKRKHYWTYVEKDGGRDEIHEDLVETIRSHYDRLERIAEDVKRLGYEVAGEILSAAMPQTTKGRSGDLGEILATELVEEEIGLRVPVRRLRYKDGRNMAMRGDDFIGAGYDGAGEKLWLLKGEAKSNKVLGKTTVTSARKALNRDNGRCTPDSLLFVANRLLESKDADDNELGRSLRDEVGLKSLRADRIDHMLFTLSGNGPHASLKEDLAATGTNRDHYVVNIHVEDHQDFIAAMYLEAEDLGDD